ncbi:Versatile peroxidase [Paramyrothecium foliicola]|nr:Versatile peroxidase [Paramyrothecium foliicola]
MIRMKSLSVLAAVLAGVDMATAYPGMGKQMEGIKRAVEERQLSSRELIGDLETLTDEELTPTGAIIKGVLQGTETVIDFGPWEGLPEEPELDTPECAADTCCIWRHIAIEMQANMVGNALRCNDLARAAVRLGFHDAGTWSRSTGRGGGADGSIVLAGECEDRPEDNAGLEGVCAQMRIWHNRWKSYGISMADLIQVGATVATVVCPLGPRYRLFVGRKDNSAPAPRNIMPFPHQSPDELLDLFADKTIGPNDLVNLLGAHTVSQQRFLDPTRAGDPQDTTPGVWNTQFYNETMNPNTPQRVFKFDSDVALSQDSRTGPLWQQFARGGESALGWAGGYARAAIRVSLLGVYNINDLTECTRVLPLAVGFSDLPPEPAMSSFLNGEPDKEAAEALLNGDFIPKSDS